MTNAENNRYPGRNHPKKDAEFARVYKFRAVDEEVKGEWVRLIGEVMEGKHSTLEDMRSRGRGGAGGGEDGDEGEGKLFKTNLARLLRRGDDWDEEGLLSEEDMLTLKAEEVR